ncbi:MAG TPA: CinA family nicotinamide mononucleotide deamidase-related protein [Tepidisphaeraceae bacterium]|nr:CinA family nicotinamide mononucleotide deamidase-related protein [Tepidisphaeraceae bacterium]
MTTIILSIGDELILGQTVDTNSAWLAQRCAAVGLRPLRHNTVSDAQDMIELAIMEAAPLADVLLITGGLGPTEDDLTRNALAAVMETDLALDPAALENVERFFKHLNRDMPPRNRVQAMIPRGAQMIENTNGTAPGIRAVITTEIAGPDDGDDALLENECHVFIMPGVPKEMRAMFDRSILPAIRTLQQQSDEPAPVIRSRTLHTFGLGESAVADLLKPANMMDRTRNPSVGTTVSGGVVSLRLNAYFDSEQEADAKLAETDALCRAALGDLVYGSDEDTLPAVVSRLLKRRTDATDPEPGLTVATAESCTGGLVAKLLTDDAGASTHFQFGWVTYANHAKTSLLGVRQETLDAHGAVSAEVVREMSAAALLLASADYALAVSGIAGPDGGTPDKPVGTVWLAIASKRPLPFPSSSPATQDSPVNVFTRRFQFPGDREMIRDRSAKTALTLLRFALLGKPLPF